MLIRSRGRHWRGSVKAGRIVGFLTAALAVTSLIHNQGSFSELLTMLLGVVGLESGLSVSALFWGNALLAASARYALGYVVGSLIGVVYDWFNRPSVAVLSGIVLVVGLGDGLLATIDTQSLIMGSAYTLAWLCYVPLFVWLFDDDDGATQVSTRRLGDP